MRRLRGSLAALAVAASAVFAHDLGHEIARGEAIVIRFSYADRAAFLYESYEVFRPGETTPFQVGRTDALGRLSFVPDAPGEWRARAFSEDGHGADFTFPVDAALAPSSTAPPGGRTARVVLGVGLILGLFGAYASYRSRRKT